MVKKAVVLALLESLREHFELLQPLQSESLRELTADPIRYNGVLHLLHTAVEHVTDIGAHLLAGSGMAVPEEYREIILKMSQHGMIPYDFAQRIAPMAGFRNIVVHQYLSVDPAMVYQVLQENLQDIALFIDYMYEFLRKQGYLEEK